MAKKFDTLDKESTALTFEACRLADALHAGDTSLRPKLAEVRAKLDAVEAEMARRTYLYGKWLCHR